MTTLPQSLHESLVFRERIADGSTSRVWYSPCDQYRYGLARIWDAEQPSLLFIMLNPSTADEYRNDPTVARCETRARCMGFGSMMVANIFAFRATLPTDLKSAHAPIGPANDALLACWASSADMILAAWGAHGSYQDRARVVAQGLPDKTYHLGLTKAGHPRHPLYVSFATDPLPWRPEERFSHLQTVD